MRWLAYLSLLVAIVLALAAGLGVWVWRRALPEVTGVAHTAGLRDTVEIVRDRWGVPHIFAANDADAYYALGWVMVQDRLFHMDVIRHVSQGRLAELFGESVVEVDTLFRTLDLPGAGRRMAEGTRPDVRAALEAFTAGANASLTALGRNLPPEYTVLRTTPAPFQLDDFAGVVGFMAFGLNPGWKLDPVYERIAAKVGPLRAAELFPQAYLGPLTAGAEPPAGSARVAARVPVHSPGRAGGPVPPALLAPEIGRLSAANEALLESLPGLSGSNSFVLAPYRSTTGHALLANDPHLAHGLPGIWYQAHLRTPQQDVIGVFIPGVPFAIIGHNRHIAWGLVNLQLDAGDFFLERLDPQRPGQVQFRGGWVPLQERAETIHVKGGQPVALTVRSTPHGPLVHSLLEGQEQALSYRWTYAVVSDTNEINGFHDLNRARDWAGFRAAVSQFGAVAQTATYADRDGHIGMQATGRIPNRKGRKDGLGYRVGWTGAEEWDGFLPFEANPSELDPGRGYVAVANHPLQPPPPYYVSGYFEPEDRIARIRELIARKERHAPEDLARIQTDVLHVSGRALAPQVVAAFDATPAGAPALRGAVEALRRWDGTMAVDSPGAAVFGVFYKHLFHEIFGDELDAETLKGMRTRTNQSAVAMHAVLQGALRDRGARWLDRQDTPAVEDRAAIFRAALGQAVEELVQRLGSDPAAWRWGDLHQIELQHPLGRVRALAPLFNLGPEPLPGHSETVSKAQFTDDDFRVYHGPSMRQITDLGDIARARAVLPAGQSGIPASPHYGDLFPLWRSGQYHPLLMDREDLTPLTEGRLVLQP